MYDGQVGNVAICPLGEGGVQGEECMSGRWVNEVIFPGKMRKSG